MTPTDRILGDLVTFARIEVEANDLEPWAAILAELHAAGVFDAETAAWAVKLYNAYDDLGSAMAVLGRWPSPYEWEADKDRADAAEFPCTQERRNLRGGRVLKHLSSYTAHLGGGPQLAWLNSTLTLPTPEANFDRLVAFTRSVWGVGRQTSFEWAEFAGKALGCPVHAGHGFLWESEGPRRSLQRIFDNPTPTAAWLDDRAREVRDHLTANGVPLEWWDFETVICDFNVMRDGRYVAGRHLAFLREEIDSVRSGSLRDALEAGWEAIVPERWRRITPGVAPRERLTAYRDTGRVLTDPW